MMESILQENTISFKELEKKIFQFVCGIGQEIAKTMLENYDEHLAKTRDRKEYRDKGKRTTTIKTLFGEVTYERRVYQTKTESGEREYIYLLDAQMQMEKIDEMLEYIQMYATSVESTEKTDKRSKKALELYKYLNNNKEGLLPYQKRNITISEAPKGIVYKNMGVQENQNCTIITLRMKHRRMRWSVNGANNMAKILYRRENKELIETIDRYSDGFILTMEMQKVVKGLTAAKTPQRDGKGSGYVDAINRKVPMFDALMTASRKAFKRWLQ